MGRSLSSVGVLLFLAVAPAATAEEKSRGYLGATVGGSDEPRGVVVKEVAPGSPGAKAGLARGDIIQKVGTTAVRTSKDFVEAVKKFSVGQKVGLLVLREKAERRLTATLGEYPKALLLEEAIRDAAFVQQKIEGLKAQQTLRKEHKQDAQQRRDRALMDKPPSYTVAMIAGNQVIRLTGEIAVGEIQLLRLQERLRELVKTRAELEAALKR